MEGRLGLSCRERMVGVLDKVQEQFIYIPPDASYELIAKTPVGRSVSLCTSASWSEVHETRNSVRGSIGGLAVNPKSNLTAYGMNNQRCRIAYRLGVWSSLLSVQDNGRHALLVVEFSSLAI